MRKISAIFFLVVLLTGCVTAPPALSNLSPVSRLQSISLEDNLIWKQKLAPLATSEAELILAKGEYVAVHENDTGTLFRGPKQCIVYEIIGGYEISSGGIWVPKNSQDKPRLYIYAYFDQVRVRERNHVFDLISNPETSEVIDQTNRNGVIVIHTSVPLTHTQAVEASGIATVIVNAMLASEIAERRGKPFLSWEIAEPSLVSLLRDKTKQ